MKSHLYIDTPIVYQTSIQRGTVSYDVYMKKLYQTIVMSFNDQRFISEMFRTHVYYLRVDYGL